MDGIVARFGRAEGIVAACGLIAVLGAAALLVMYTDRGDSDVIAAVETTTTLAETTIDPEPEPNDLPAAPTTQALEVDAAPGSTPESTDAEPTVLPSSAAPAPRPMRS